MDRLFKARSRLLTNKMSRNAAIAPIEDCLGHRASPRRIHSAVKGVQINPRLLSVIRKPGLVAGQEAANEIHFRGVIHVHAEDSQPLRGILSLELNNHRIFIAAGLTPGGPKCDQDRLALIFRKYLIVTSE